MIVWTNWRLVIYWMDFWHVKIDWQQWAGSCTMLSVLSVGTGWWKSSRCLERRCANGMVFLFSLSHFHHTAKSLNYGHRKILVHIHILHTSTAGHFTVINCGITEAFILVVIWSHNKSRALRVIAIMFFSVGRRWGFRCWRCSFGVGCGNQAGMG